MSSSSPDGVALGAVLERIAPRMRSSDAVLLVDGRSGSGKTTLAAALAPRLGARVLHLEEVYPGWTGLDAAARLLALRLLPAFRAGRVGWWRRWDWELGRYGAAASLRPGGRLIVEGCGAVTADSARLATCSLVLDLDESVRRRRIVRRDPPEAMSGHAVWAEAERRFAAQARPGAVADLVLRGGVRLPNGPTVGLGTVSG